VIALLRYLRQRWIRFWLALAATAVLGALLVATIYWTISDLQWMAFLGGVLFAALLAMASRASKVEWLIVRRTRQLERMRQQTAEATARARNTAEALRISNARAHFLADALPTLTFFVDREERVRFHNLAAAEAVGRTAKEIDGNLLRDVVGSDLYSGIAVHLARALSGETVAYELAWKNAQARAGEVYAVRHVPYPPGSPEPQGLYLLMTPQRAEERASPAPEPEPGPVTDPPTQSGGDGGQALYLRSITDEMMGWDDPRAKLAFALEHDQFLLFAQKILPLRPDAPDCCEVLLRLQEEEDNLLPPGGFLPVAERYGMMSQLDQWVVKSVISHCMARRRAAPGWRQPIYCVNVSETTLGDPDFALFVVHEIKQQRFDARSLCFEIGEPEVINQRANVKRFLAALKPAGCRFTVDSFGSVKVSFSHLRGLPFDFIKIDGVIIQNILRNPAELTRARAITSVCRKIGVRAIAEFVEDDETLAVLREIGVDYAQGFGIARPGPIAGQD
jgi:EAL domain-containing protein (putative c-di-GMP-specific phosphodiesterase class I)/PAS domain-containing protein